jgi:hypothetical protein
MYLNQTNPNKQRPSSNGAKSNGKTTIRNPSKIFNIKKVLKRKSNGNFMFDMNTQTYIDILHEKEMTQSNSSPMIRPKGNNEDKFRYKSIDRRSNSQNVVDCLRKYKCEYSECGKRYKTKENLILHVRNIHLKEKPYQCVYCESKFSHRNGKYIFIIILCRENLS